MLQIRQPDEIIVVDDGSTDDTKEVLEKLKTDHPNLFVISQENKGNAGAKNTGINNAKSEWVAFLDADDVWLPNRLSSQVELLKIHPSLNWVAGAYLQVTYEKNGTAIVRGKSLVEQKIVNAGDSTHESLELIAGPTSVWIGTVMARTSSIRALDGFCEALLGCDDSDLWVRMAFDNEQIGFVCEPVARYTVAQHGSLTGMAARTVSPSQFTHYERLSRLISATPDTRRKELVARILNGKIESSLRALLRTRSFPQVREFKLELKNRGLPVPPFWILAKAFWPPWKRSR